MLKAARQVDGKALNGLDFPRSAPGEFPLPAATDVAVWDQVYGEPWCEDAFPWSSMRWGLCATAGAYHKAHKDCEGGCTFVAPESGVKLWLVGVPRTDSTENFDDLASIDAFTSAEYNIWETNSHLVDWAAVVLQPGTAL